MTEEERNYKLAMLMKAFLSRPERWSVEEYRWEVEPGRYRIGIRFAMNGTIETDHHFMDAIEGWEERLGEDAE